MSDMMRVVGERIRSLRKERGLSQEELAHRAFLHPTYIGQIERAEKKTTTLESLTNIANALEVTLEEFFRFIQPAQEKNNDLVLTQIMTRLQSRSLEDQKYFLSLLDSMLEWKDR